MSQISIYLTPNGTKEFLATTEPLSHVNSTHNDDDLPNEIIIDSYTRESWCRSSSSSSPSFSPHSHDSSNSSWHGMWLKSIDKRCKLPGFIKFLKGRAKAAYCKFVSPAPDEITGEDRFGLFLVPFEQPQYPSKDILAMEGITDVGDLIYVKYNFDLSVAEKKTGQGQQQGGQQLSQQQQNIGKRYSIPMTKTNGSSMTVRNQNSNLSTNISASSTNSTKGSGGGGLLGNLLGRQERTNRNLEAVPSIKRKSNPKNSSTIPSSSDDVINNINHDSKDSSNPLIAASIQNPIFTTSNQIISHFESKVKNKLEAFAASSSQTQIKIVINLAEEIRFLQSNIEEKSKVTMDVLKYIVNEQSDEIGFDEWVAHKEPSEFMDEVTIAIYKAGYAPDEVLEEMNRGEMPEEVRNEQRAMREALTKEQNRKAKLEEEMNIKKAAEQDRIVQRLNQIKRDRRSTEQIQRDMENDSKRSRCS